MKSSAKKIELASVDDLFSTEEGRQDAKLEKIQEIPLSELHPFRNHPFKVKDDEAMMETADSIKQYGVLVPAIARPDPEGGYELVAGHRRHRASELAEKETMPVIVRDLDDDAATIIMVDSNLQRESLLPSERAFAYKMKLDAMKHQGERVDLTSSQVGTKLRADEILAQQAGSSRNQVQRYIRLTELIPELMDMVDEKKIALNPAYELSFLKKEEQVDLLDAMDSEQATPSLSQAQRLKKYSQEGHLTLDMMRVIMGEEKKSDLDRVTFTSDTLRKYFPKSYVEVSRLKLMKADHQSKQYRLEDQLLKYFPEEIEKHKGFIKGFESDLEVLAAHPHPEDGFAGMEIRGDLLTDKENAGAALLDACKEVKTSDPVQIGSYRGYAISVEFSAWKQEYTLLLKGQMTHRATLGTDPRGNLTRIDNALAQMPQRLEAAKAQLDNLYQQQAAAKEEVGKPFLYEEELRSKNARLVELDTLLNIDGKGQAHTESVVAKSTRPSVLDNLKRPVQPRSTDKKPKQHEEVR